MRGNNIMMGFNMISIIKEIAKWITFAVMIKQLTASLLLLAFVIQMFSGQFIKLDYYLNTAAYAKNCENKAKPKLHCNGKCQMMKKLKQEEKKDQQLPERKFENKTEVLSSKSFFYSIENTLTLIIEKPSAFEQKQSLADISYAFFHPPQA
ncbi:MAG: hypothetical protein IPP48_05380 [Chitinophagaceae bacterium]|nr:hypothetical protein [Chitinophagaceae bacterium]